MAVTVLGHTVTVTQIYGHPCDGGHGPGSHGHADGIFILADFRKSEDWQTVTNVPSELCHKCPK
jgi:hypothetical protein